MPAFTSLQQRQQQLIRKALNGGIWVAPSSAAAPTAMSSGASSDPAALPANYTDVGYITKDDGASWSRDMDTSDTTSWGAFEPTRRDITSDVTNLKFTMQETKRLSLELSYGVDLSAVTPTATTGEVAFNQASANTTIYRRFLAIMADGVGLDAVYIARFCPRMSITTVDDQSWTDGNELQWPVTGTAFVDPVLGYAVRHFFFGPGWKSQLVAAGFPAAT
ncbi:MAG: hypothetical protein J0I34_07270 [Pseudonocardia sp.]|uniref:phage tail tube protein n=1 Tax=Actinomycetes TaxID=1760 RepID=UPI00086D980A|nr:MULTISPECIES: hypothetical protein [Actinomycetes]MBN9108567.1 hypothetical protein [Pseudonocardia sp.]ODU27447.1 MAG: hypothetical protein ABS80_03460 [Pseudonocardia sp. SCN 72-51]ODV07791.1 MAG: hypothetical protein ABT15_06860 [Pseudonocardia sp. SCN 73-27]